MAHLANFSNDSSECSHEFSDESEEEIPETEEEKINRRKCFFRLNDIKKVKWDLFIMILATWN